MKFTPKVASSLGSYVYRLIDPRNGETFYVGRGKGNRVFQHVKGELGTGADDLTSKLKRIRAIRVSGFEVDHLIHRHGMDEATACEVEAALIDAYPETQNEISGVGSDQRGLMHAQQIIQRYEAREAIFRHKILMINVGRSVLDQQNIYEAVRYSWKIDPAKAWRADFVLAVQQGLIIGTFVAVEWLDSTSKNFPGRQGVSGRWGFVGREAPEQIKKQYVGKRVPDRYRRQGAANPIRYSW
jgi:hypothetical protein